MTDDHMLSRRRALLAALATASSGISGCFGSPTESRTEESGPMTNRTSTENTERVDSSGPEVGWRVEDPGEPRWADEPGWRTYGHDTANSFRNPRAVGPSDSPTVEWTFDPGVSTLAARAHHPTIVDGTVYTRRAVEPSDGPTDESRYQIVAIEGETGDVEPLIDSERPLARPVVTEDTIYAAIGSDRASIHAFDRDTGTERWRTDQLLYEPFTIRPVEDVVIATDASPAWGVSDGEPDADEGSPELFAIDSETGAVQWDARGIGPNINDDYGQALTTDAVSVFEGTATVRRLDDGEIAGVLPPLEGGAADRLSDALFDDTLVSVGQTDDAFVVAAHDWKKKKKRWSRTFHGDRGGCRVTCRRPA